jgi:hypothetical protein
MKEVSNLKHTYIEYKDNTHIIYNERKRHALYFHSIYRELVKTEILVHCTKHYIGVEYHF